MAIGQCNTCGNTYDRSFEVTTHTGVQYTFDSLECAAARLAPECARCGCRILGHGVQAGGTIYCCAHCAREEGIDDLVDNTAEKA